MGLLLADEAQHAARAAAPRRQRSHRLLRLGCRETGQRCRVIQSAVHRHRVRQ